MAMKKICYILFLCKGVLLAQSSVEVSAFQGSILKHNESIGHLIVGHPQGVLVRWNRHTYGKEAWESNFNYPDYGLSFMYQDMANPVLGKNIGLYGHYNFYFLKRHLQFAVGTGLSYNTKPYHKENNPRNNAYATHLLSSTYFKLGFHYPHLFGRVGLDIGTTFVHYSIGNIKAPNTSTNTWAIYAGLQYDMGSLSPEFQSWDTSPYTEAWAGNFSILGGVSESDVVGSGQYPFYILQAMVDKRISRKSGLQLGTELFFTRFLKEYIRYQSIAYPGLGVSGKEDYKRLGIFAGYELYINKLSAFAQIGYYLYYPVAFEGRVYNRAGLKRYFGKHWNASIAIKAHAAKAESIEFGLTYRWYWKKNKQDEME